MVALYFARSSRPTSTFTGSIWANAEVQAAILAEVTERLKPAQGELLADADDGTPALDLSAVVAKTTEIVVQQTIDILAAVGAWMVHRKITIYRKSGFL